MKVKGSSFSMKVAVCTSDKYSTPCPSDMIRCTPVASPVDQFAESVSPAPIYAAPANKRKVFYAGHKENLSPVIFWKNWWSSLK